MLHTFILDFLVYCKAFKFAAKSLETLSVQLTEFDHFINQLSIHNIQDISYLHLTAFVARHRSPSIHIQKQRVWTMRKFFHYLKIQDIIKENIAASIPYPKIAKKVPYYLTENEFNELLEYATQKANNLTGLRNLIIFMILGLLGLRLKALQNLNIEDVSLHMGTLLVQEKGAITRRFYMPQILCAVLAEYLKLLNLSDGPLFLSKRKKRISERTLQLVFQEAMAHLKIDKHLHAHLFRHTAGTLLNKVAGPVVTGFVLGHARSENTKIYTHLNPDQYAVYMKKHSYHSG
ncbi:tyrosine-type recombinase/integrase [candidate division KSB1 bacterium]|nr:tyrosine-type recombinase/integrase [candidate division KSB1 bacterium]